MTETVPRTADDPHRPTPGRLHTLVGWWFLLVYLTLGIGLETMHAFKLQWYLNVDNEVRRLMFRLAHTHGTLLAILNIVFALSVARMREWRGTGRVIASRCLLAATFLVPVGFLLGGVFIRAESATPGLGVVLVPPGALLLWIAVLLIARAAGRTRD